MQTILDGDSRMRASRRSCGRHVALLAVLGAAAAGHAEETPAIGLGEAIAGGRFTLELRPRYNRIDESDKEYRTEGVTMRTAAGWRSGAYHGLRLTAELLNASHIGAERFNHARGSPLGVLGALFFDPFAIIFKIRLPPH